MHQLCKMARSGKSEVLPVAHNKIPSVYKQHWALLPFIAGVLIGLALSTAVLIRPYTESITNVYIRLPEENKLDKLAEFRRMIEEMQIQKVGGIRHLAQEVSVKGPVYYAVVMRDRHSSEQLEVLRNTWTRDVSSRRVGFFISAEGENAINDQDLHYGEINATTAAEQTGSVIELPNSQLLELQALKYICKHEVNHTKWFFISSDNVYVKTQSLEHYLQQFENVPEMDYIGKPMKKDPIGRVCMPGPGTVFSYSALVALCPKLDTCLKSGSDAVQTEFPVGECVRRQLPDLQCNKEGQPHDLFLKFDGGKQGLIIEPKNHRLLDSALTIYPIGDPKLMYLVHQFVVSRILNETQHELQQLKHAVDQMSELLPQSDVRLHRDAEPQDAIASKDDIVAWKLINHNLLMSDEENNPALKVPTPWKNEFNLLTQKALEYLNSKSEEQYAFKKVVNGYWKVDPLVGIQYIIDFEAKKAGTESDNNEVPNRYRVTFTRPLNPPEASLVKAHVSDQHVNVAVFLTSEQLEQFQGFMKMLAKVLEHDQRINLLVVQMRSAAEKQKLRRTITVMDPKSIISLYETKYPKASFKVLDSPSLLSRAHGTSLVMKELRPSEILFLADLDLEFDAGFVERCRNYPLQGQQVYFPVMFAKINPSVLSYMNHTMLENTISKHSGYWLIHSYSVACVYAADLFATTSQTGFKGIPNEVDTIEVYNSLMEKGYEIIRAMDKGLKRAYSQKDCDLDLYGEEHHPCKAPGEVYSPLYIKTQLSVLLFDHEGEHTETKF